MRRQRNLAQMKQIKTLEKEPTKMGDKQSIRCRVQNTGYRILKYLSEDLNSIKKIQSEMKNILIEIKANLQGNNRRVDESKNQINNMEYKEA